MLSSDTVTGKLSHFVSLPEQNIDKSPSARTERKDLGMEEKRLTRKRDQEEESGDERIGLTRMIRTNIWLD